MRDRILVVEDSRTQAEALNALLSGHDYTVDVALSGEAALDSAREVRYDLILSDILMPGMSGYELCARIKDEPAIYGSPPIVLLTSLSDPIDIVRGLESGADNYLTKPYEPDRLLSWIDQILSVQAARRERTPDGGVPLTFLGQAFTIRARREQVLDFFLSSFEELVEMNRVLEESKEELHRTLEREQAARHAAEAAIAARDAVLATVSHDLRNPLNTILMSASLLLDYPEGELDEAGRERAAVIRRLAHQMNRLIQDLLDVATVQAGALTIEPSWHNAAALYREGLEMIEPIAATNGLCLISELSDELPQIHVDRARIHQVLSNLVGNAIKFTPRGGSVTLEAWARDGALVCKITDTGPGIPSHLLTRIFDRFWKIGGMPSSGAGLGLSIARDIVEAHGGRIWAESEPGHGARFFFSIPLEPVAHEA